MITINIDRAKEVHLEKYNSHAVQAAQQRTASKLAGVALSIADDTEWVNKLNADRMAIASATTTAEILSVQFPSP